MHSTKANSIVSKDRVHTMALSAPRRLYSMHRRAPMVASKLASRTQQRAEAPVKPQSKVEEARVVTPTTPTSAVTASTPAPKPFTGILPSEVIAFVLGGGQGMDLYPLTSARAEPAVPLLGSYRLIDVTVSNCLNSNINKVYVLTQFNSRPLNRHLSHAYAQVNAGQLGSGEGFVEPLNATLTSSKDKHKDWFRGTADAVRQYLWLLNNPRYDDLQEVIVLCGDQIYRMDYNDIIESHRRSNADVTLACIPCTTECASQFGVLEVDGSMRVQALYEKPDACTIGNLKTNMTMLGATAETAAEKPIVANMGVYVFKKKVLQDLLMTQYPEALDFSRDILAPAAKTLNVKAFPFHGYWQDVGTLLSYYETSMAIVSEGNAAALELWDNLYPIYTAAKVLPPAKIRDAEISSTLIGHGCCISGATIRRSILGDCTRVGEGTVIEDSITFGADFFEFPGEVYDPAAELPLGIAPGCTIRKAIIDKNARIGQGVQIINKNGVQEANRESEGFCIRNGIVCVLRGASIAAGTRI